jgi:fumarate hydratase class I
MDAATLEAMRKYGAVYIQAVGGAAAVSAAAVKRVQGVDFLDEFGAAEACWHFEVGGFRGVVAMDSSGTSLFDRVAASSREKFLEFFS